MKYHVLKNKHMQDRLSGVFKDLDVFFAFNDKQMKEGLHQAKVEIDDIVSIGSGGFIPRKNAKLYADRSEQIMTWFDKEVRKIDPEEVIEYELCNHECYYTGDTTDAYEAVKDYGYTQEQVRAVYQKNASKHYDD